MKNPPATAASLYASDPKIYARTAKGRYARLRTATMLALLGSYYLLPWLQWQGRPLVLFDLPARRFHLLGLTLFPQDLFLLAALLVVAALTLFLFTTLAGRLWCGYACPQTAWTELFMWIERRVEGERHQRQKLERSRWTANKIARRTLKHALWATLGLYTGLSFVAYFMPARQLFGEALTLSLAGWPLFWSLFYGFATWGNAGFMREQVCKYMCPYARFQSAMFDRDTLIIGYDAQRGEPRKGAGKVMKLAELPAAPGSIGCPSTSPLLKNTTAQLLPPLAGEPLASARIDLSRFELSQRRDGGATIAPRLNAPTPALPRKQGRENFGGDCIDCTLCVQVCPVGIDIRDGLQYECIACAACVDACNGVMDHVGKPRGLIRYTSERRDHSGAFQILRPRLLGYGLVWVAVIAGFGALLMSRSPIGLDVLRDRRQLFREMADGRIANLYTLKIANKGETPMDLRIVATRADGSALNLSESGIHVDASSTESLVVAALLPPEQARGVQSVHFDVSDVDSPEIHQGHDARFIGARP